MKRLFDKLSSREQSLLLLLAWSVLVVFGYGAIREAFEQFSDYNYYAEKIDEHNARLSEGEQIEEDIRVLLKNRTNDIDKSQLEIDADRLAKKISRSTWDEKKTLSRGALFDQHMVKITFSHAQWSDLQEYVEKIKNNNGLFLSEVELVPKYKTRNGTNKEKIQEIDYFKGVFTVSSLQLKDESFL